MASLESFLWPQYHAPLSGSKSSLDKALLHFAGLPVLIEKWDASCQLGKRVIYPISRKQKLTRQPIKEEASLYAAKRKPDKNPALINTIYYEKTGVKILSGVLRKHDDNHLKT